MEPISPHTFGWENVRGWLTEEEATELARLSVDKVVLEVGTFCGRSALAMAPSARRVFCLDNFSGYRKEEAHRNVRDEALGNFDRAGHNGKIVVLAGTQEEVLPRMNLSDIDMVFYDADHSFDGTDRAIKLMKEAGLRDSATLVFHDYSSTNPGVTRAVDNYWHSIDRKPRIAGTLAIFDGEVGPERKPETDSYNVMLAIPTYDGNVHYGAAQGLFRGSWKHDVKIQPSNQTSLLASGVNRLWAAALNRADAGDITHLAVLHADIEPCDGWIDVLIEEMEKKGVSFISAVSPLKDSRGITSTGIGEPGLAWSPIRRFAMKEIMGFPETFNAEDTGNPDKVLLLNTGCWVADLRDPRFATKNANNEGVAFFTINDRTVYTDNQWIYQVESEDWFFSRRLHELRIPMAATRKVSLLHHGSAAFSNNSEWGTEECDEDLRPMWDREVRHADL